MDLVYLSVAQGLILIFGGIVVFYAWRAYGRTKSSAMLLLGLGFAFVTAGAAIAGVLFNVANEDLTTVESVQALSQAVGFLIIVYSLTRTKD
jgi:branched-subunit amino acid ABC-type transport system permease component